MFVPLATDWDSLHGLLRGLYEEMMPLCSNMMGLAKGVAGLGALFFIAYRVWKSLSNAEPIDVFPLLRPFVVGLCIMFFPTFVLGTINTVLSPVTRSCADLVDSQVTECQSLQTEKDRLEKEAIMRDPTRAYLVDDDEFERQLNELGIWDTPEIVGMHLSRTWYKVKMWCVDVFRSFLEMVFQASSLIIDTIRTFFLIVLTILGPLSFALSVYDGFQSTLTNWIQRYISIYLWLPVSDLFSAIITRIRMLILRGDITQLQDPTYIPDSTSAVYVIFMLIGIVGYFCVPTVASWIVQAGGAGAYGRNVNRATGKASGMVGGFAGAATGRVSGKLKGR
jgi:conjugative transposon TraJ protein